MKRLWEIICVIGLTLFAFFVFHVTWMILDGINDEIANVEAIVVLGNKVNEDGTLSKRLKARLDKALELYEENFSDVIVVSGGFGKEGYFEGDVMRDYLIENGVPLLAIVVDNKGDNTFFTAKNIKTLGYKRVLVVTNYYHVLRTEMIFKKFGLEVYSVKAEMWPELRDPYSIFREFVGYYYYFLRY